MMYVYMSGHLGLVTSEPTIFHGSVQGRCCWSISLAVGCKDHTCVEGVWSEV